MLAITNSKMEDREEKVLIRMVHSLAADGFTRRGCARNRASPINDASLAFVDDRDVTGIHAL